MRQAEHVASREIPKLLQDWLGNSVRTLGGDRNGPDLVMRSGTRSLIIEVKRSDDIAAIEQACRRLKVSIARRPQAVGLLAVPYMGPKAREYARALGVSWLDLSGNADIRAPGIRVLIEGKPNRFRSPGRPSTAFSPRASRVARAMLVEPQRWWLQRELAHETRLSGGYVSKVVSRLAADDLVELRPADGRVRPRAPKLLLDAWGQVYRFDRHAIARFHAVGRSGLAVLKEIARGLSRQAGGQWAASGLGAAWQWTRFADFRLTTFFVSNPVDDPESLGLRPVERGENVWIVVPRDEGVFHGAEEVAGVKCVHPVQVYLDLLGHPERAQEAAAHLRAEKLTWAS